MRRADVTLTIALCVSLIAHGAIAAALTLQYARHLAQIYLPAAKHLSASVAAASDAEDPFGKERGTGDAIADFRSERKLMGRDAPVPQAFLSRDARGPGYIGADPSMNVMLPGEGGTGEKAKNDPGSVSHALRASAVMSPAVADAQLGAGPSMIDFAPAYKKLKDAPKVKAIPAPASPKPASAAPPGPATPAADPAPLSESEADAFAKTASVEISEGNVEAKMGRKVKTVRPRLSLAAQIDLLSMQFPRIKLRVRLDMAGKPAKVDVLKSSGSATADQEVKLAVYQWEFGPDPKTKPNSPDTIEFEIVWR